MALLKKIDLSQTNLPMDGDNKIRSEYRKKINEIKEAFTKELGKRRNVLQKRLDFYVGNHEKYTTIYGKKTAQKKGHASGVFNYVGRSGRKIAFALANNPPTMTFPARKLVPDGFQDAEATRAQSVEEFVEEVFRQNQFKYKAYRRAVFNQVNMGDAAIKTYPVNIGTGGKDDWVIKITNHEKLENVMVAWRGDDNFEFDSVISIERRTIKSIEDEFHVKIPKELALPEEQNDKIPGNDSTTWSDGTMWTQGKGPIMTETPSELPSVILTEYDDLHYYCLMVGNDFIEFAEKDNVSMPKMKFWTFVPNIPVPRQQWSMSDLDDAIEPQIEFNEASNEERDYIRVGAAQKFVAYNMSGFDPKSISTGSGGVIFVDSTDNTSRFEPLPTNVNVFPIDSFLNRVHDVIFDMSVPKVTYGSSGADSGRSKTIDYQSMVELLDFKRGSWEMALNSIVEKIQQLGDFYFGDSVDYFKDPETNKYVTRYPDYDWAEVMPITQADKVVNVLNKIQMGLPFRLAFKELGYTDVEGVIKEMKKEAKDPELMEFRSKMYQLTGGIVEATKKAQAEQESMNVLQGAPTAPGAPQVNQSQPTLVGGSQGPQPVSSPGTAASSTPAGLIARQRQNLQAQGG